MFLTKIKTVAAVLLFLLLQEPVRKAEKRFWVKEVATRYIISYEIVPKVKKLCEGWPEALPENGWQVI